MIGVRFATGESNISSITAPGRPACCPVCTEGTYLQQ